MAKKSVLELLMDDHQSTYEPKAGLGYGVQPDDLGAMGVLPRSARPRPPAIPDEPQPDSQGLRAPDITVSGTGAAGQRAEPPEIPAGTEVPATGDNGMGSPRIFRSSRGPDGAYNMGADAPMGSVQTNAAGVPLGQVMIPVRGLSSGEASVGVPNMPEGQMGPRRSQINLAPDVPGMAGNIGNLDRVAQESPMVRSLVNSGVIRATETEKSTLGRMRSGMFDQGSANTRDQARQQQEVDFARARMAGNDQAKRQIAVAQGTPQVVASGAGVGGWDPSTGQPFSEVRAPNVYQAGKTLQEHQKIQDPETGMTAAQLLAGFAKARPRSANDPASKIMLSSAIQAAQGDQEKIRQAQEMFGKDNPGDPQMAAYFQRRLNYLGIDPLAEAPAVAAPEGAPAATQTPAATAKQTPTATAKQAPAAKPEQSFRDKYARK